MKKSVTKIVKAVLGFTLAIGAGISAGTSNPKTNPVYATVPSDTTITFNQANGNNDSSTAYTTSSTIANVANGTAAFSSVSDTSKAYAGKSGTGLKFGTSSAYGYIGFTLADGYQNNLKSIKVTVLKYSTDTGNVILKTGSTSNTWSSGSAQKMTITPSSSSSTNFDTYVFATPSTVGRIWLGTSAKRAYVTEVVLHYEENAGPSVQIDEAPAYLVKGGGSGELTASITNDNDYTITWSASPSTGVSFSSTTGSNVTVSFGDTVTSGTTPITITATLSDAGSTFTTKEVYALDHAGTESDPFSATDAQVFSHSDYAAQSGGDWYVQGYVVGIYSTNKGYYIDEDSSNTSSRKFEVFNSSGIPNSTGKDIIIGTSYIVAHGAMTCYNGTQSESTGSIVVSVDNGAVPSVVIDGGDRTVFVGDSLTLTATTENPDDAIVTWSSDDSSVADINSSTGAVDLLSAGVANITATITVETVDYVNTIALTVVENVLTDGDTFIIKATHSATDYYLTGVTDNAGTTSVTDSDAMIFTAIEGATSGQFQFKNGNNFLSYSGSSNNLYTTTDDEADSTLWTAINNGSAIIVESVKVSGRKLQFNYNNGSPKFACYTSNQEAVSIEKVVTPEVDSVTVVGDTTADANNALSIVKEFLYDVTYVNPLNPGNSSVDVAVLNSSDGTSGASITSAPNGTSFSVTFTASDTYTVTVTSHEDPGKSDSMSIVVSNICVPPDYELYEEATLVEGDYLIVFSGAAMNNTITSDRAQYEEVTPINDKISTNDASIIWHIAPAEEGYFTIYNAESGKYLASTGAKNKAQLLVDGTDDKSLWSINAENGEFDFINKQNTTNGVNAILRKNGTYGFACYADGTGGALSLYRLNDIKAYLSSASTVATLTENILRLGSTISAEKWNSIVATAEITDYGVMIYKTDSESKITSSKPVENAYRAGVVLPAVARKGNGVPPSLTDGNYVFTARIRVSNPDTIFCSASFIVAGGQYYFFNEQHVAASELAS